MKPIPIDFHIGPLDIHTYGIGLAVTFWFAYRYFERRVRARGYPVEWLTSTFLWIVVAAVVGARVVHVAAHLNYYSANPGQILAVWHGGLSSFGGLLFAVPTGILMARRRCPQLPLSEGIDLVAPVLVAAWAVGRLLGPQLMFAGGGKPTTAWYGMSYAGQVGKRIPVPIFQSLECFAILAVVLLLERRFRAGPTGLVPAVAAGLWGVARFFDEFLWLNVNGLWDAVEVTGLILAVASFAVAAVLLVRHSSRSVQPESRPATGTEAPAGSATPITVSDDRGSAVRPG